MSWSQHVVDSMSWRHVVGSNKHVVERKKKYVVEGGRGHTRCHVVECKNECVVEGGRGHTRHHVVEYKNKHVVEGGRGHKHVGVVGTI